MVRKDMEPSSAVVSSGDLQPLSKVAAEYFLCGVTAADFRLAGVAETTGEKALKLWHLRNATSFNGA